MRKIDGKAQAKELEVSDQARRPTVERPVPGRVWYVVAILAALAGLAGAGYRVYTNLDGLTAGMVQVVVPGEAELSLEPGRYTIFHESESTVDGRIFSGTDVTGLFVRIAPVDGGAPLAIEQPRVTSNYEIGGRSGRSVLVFDVTAPGAYRLVAGYPEGEEGSEAVLAVGRGVTGRILSLVFSALGIAFLGVVAGAIIAVVTYRRRRAGLAHA
jgi:hypothetical protein